MKVHLCIYGLCIWFALTGCNNTMEDGVLPDPGPADIPGQQVPEGYFVASFSGILPQTKAAVSGPDHRVQHIRYLVYKSTGEFVKSRVILSPGTVPSWPFQTVRDTLKRGAYKAVFLGNVEKTLFPYALPGSPVNYAEVLQNYTTTYGDARINLPGAPFKDSTEYYWAKADFSDAAPNPPVLLQRVISMMNVHRNVVDAQAALDSLVKNIVTEMHYENILQTTARGALTQGVKNIIGSKVSDLLLIPLGGLDGAANLVVSNLINPLTDTLYNHLLSGLVHQIGLALSANENQSGLLGVLGEVLNPWEFSQAHTAIVSIRDFPKSINFDLAVQEKYTGIHDFRYDFSSDEFFAQKCIYIKGFSGLSNIQKIHVIKDGLIGGVLVNGVIDNSLLLEGNFVDITDSLLYTPAVNRRYKNDYSFLDLGLKSYQQQTDGAQPLTLSVNLGQVADINGTLGKILLLGPILELILSPLNDLQISLPFNLPLLGISNLSLSGGWSAPVPY